MLGLVRAAVRGTPSSLGQLLPAACAAAVPAALAAGPPQRSSAAGTSQPLQPYSSSAREPEPAATAAGSSANAASSSTAGAADAGSSPAAAQHQHQKHHHHSNPAQLAAGAAGGDHPHPSFAAGPAPQHAEPAEPGTWGYYEEGEQYTDGQQQQYARVGSDPAFDQQRQQLLAAALRHVPQLGWAGGAAAAAAATELGLSPAAGGMLGSGSGAELAQLFVAECNRRLEAELAGMQQQLEGMDVRERIHLALQLRLRMLEPHISRWPQALALMAQPAAVPRTLRLYAELADAIWHAAGDASTDYRWYTRRALISAAYSATELYMLTDCTPGFADTWAALDRRLADVWEVEQAAQGAGSLVGVAGGTVGAALSQLAGLLRRPMPPPAGR